MDNRLLTSDTARRLYHEVAASCPVVDFHTHLDPKIFAEDLPFREVVDLWIRSDPYKWRAMRMNGIPERVITGEALPQERFRAWAATLPRLQGNPLFTWSLWELKTFFGIADLPTPANADDLLAHCNAVLAGGTLTPRSVLRRCGVEQVMTSDAPEDGLSAHQRCRNEDASPTLTPSMRIDSTADGGPVLPDNLDGHMDRFHRLGCRLADLGLDRTKGDPNDLVPLAAECATRGWILQLHLGAERDTSTRLAACAGRAGGYACMGNGVDIPWLCRLLDACERENALPRMILYPLNPNDYESLATLCGSFAEDGMPGKITLGPAWWYNDHPDGMVRQLRAIARHGLLGCFPGMVTDSRSYLSGIRHDLFRRVLCSQLGDWAERGEILPDPEWLDPLVRGICVENARSLFRAAP